jgi:sirohydrochlorin ferrochelatase
MTVSPSSQPGPRPLDVLALDSTAQLMTRLTDQLHTQLRSIRPARPPSACAPPPAAVAVAGAHGSRDPEALRTIRALLGSVRALRPGLRIELGHIELNEPALADTLAALPARTETVLVPLLFGRGHHIKNDIPRALAAAPHLRAAVAEPLGPHPLLAAALHERLLEAGRQDRAGQGSGTGGSGRDATAVVLAAAGSRDPESAQGAQRIAAQLRERLGGRTPVVPAYASAARPSVDDALRSLHAAGHSRVALASCFTAPGHFAARCAAVAPWIVSAPIGAHPALARLVLHRFDEARRAAAVRAQAVHA